MSEDIQPSVDSSKVDGRKGHTVGAILAGSAICLALPLLAVVVADANGAGVLSGVTAKIALLLLGALFAILSLAATVVVYAFLLLETLGSLLGAFGIFPYFALIFFMSKRSLTLKGYVWGNRWADAACTAVATASLIFMAYSVPEPVILEYMPDEDLSSFIWDPVWLSYALVLLALLTVVFSDSEHMFLYRASPQERKKWMSKATSKDSDDFLIGPLFVVVLTICSIFSIFSGPDTELRKSFQLTDRADPDFDARYQEIIENTVATVYGKESARMHFVDLDSLELDKRKWNEKIAYVVNRDHQAALSCEVDEDGKITKVKVGTFDSGLFSPRSTILTEYSSYLYHWVCAVKLRTPS